MNEIYLESIAQEQLLSDAEERQLADRIKIGDAKALEKLTKANLKFVVSIANQYRGRGLSEDDLVSEGNIAMMHAAQKFDSSRGTRFVVFAAPFIRQAMEDAIQEQQELYKVPKNGGDKSDHLQARALSIDQPIPVGSKNNFTLQSVIEDQNSPHADADINQAIIKNELAEGFSVLNERERQVIAYIYGLHGESHTMADVGLRMGLKRERVRQIRDKALRKLSRRIKR